MSAIFDWFARKTGLAKDNPQVMMPGRVAMLGIDTAGKTTILYRLKLGEIVQTIPTIGFNVETIKVGGTQLDVWDCSSNGHMKSFWHYYTEPSSAIVYVVSLTDEERWEETKEWLHKTLSDPKTVNAKVLILINKYDGSAKENASPTLAQDMVDKLSLRELPQRHWTIQLCSAISGEGLLPGFKWLANALSYPNQQDTTDTAEEGTQEKSASTATTGADKVPEKSVQEVKYEEIDLSEKSSAR